MNENHVLRLAQAQSKLDAREWGTVVDGKLIPSWEDRDRPVQEEYLSDARKTLLLVRALGYTHPEDSEPVVEARSDDKVVEALKHWGVHMPSVVRGSLTEDGYYTINVNEQGVADRTPDGGIIVSPQAWQSDAMREHVLRGVTP